MQVREQAKRKKEAENPFSKPAKKMTDPVALRKMLRKQLPKLVAHEQGLDLSSSKKVSALFTPQKSCSRSHRFQNTWAWPSNKARGFQHDQQS